MDATHACADKHTVCFLCQASLSLSASAFSVSIGVCFVSVVCMTLVLRKSRGSTSCEPRVCASVLCYQ